MGALPIESKIQKIIYKKPKKSQPPSKFKNAQQPELLDFEEEFGMLFEWTHHLSLENLKDYTLSS